MTRSSRPGRCWRAPAAWLKTRPSSLTLPAREKSNHRRGTKAAWQQLWSWQTRRACSRRPRSMMRWRGWQSGVTWRISLPPKGTWNRSSGWSGQEVIEHVADPHGASSPHHDSNCRHCGRSLLYSGDFADAHRHLSKPQPADHLRGTALRRYEPQTNGRVPRLLLRISFSLHQWYRDSRGQVDSEQWPP